MNSDRSQHESERGDEEADRERRADPHELIDMIGGKTRAELYAEAGLSDLAIARLDSKEVIGIMFDDAEARAQQWEPRPCPPRRVAQ